MTVREALRVCRLLVTQRIINEASWLTQLLLRDRQRLARFGARKTVHLNTTLLEAIYG